MQIERGRRIVEVLKQPQYEPMPVENQVAILYAVTQGYLDDVAPEKVAEWENGFHKYLNSTRQDVLGAIKEKKVLDEAEEKILRGAIEEYKKAG
jgi:F-type H+-transporting ATPase subunit alpha